MLKCPDHLTYKAIYPPRVECSNCWAMWWARQIPANKREAREFLERAFWHLFDGLRFDANSKDFERIGARDAMKTILQAQDRLGAK